jgi:hypothetical protein
MRTIPAAIKTLLKSRSMLGEDAPRAQVTLLDKSAGYTDPIWTTPQYVRGTPLVGSIYWGYGNWVIRSDGRVLVTYFNSNEKNVYLSYVDTEDELLYASQACATNEWVHETLTGLGHTQGTGDCRSTLFKLSSGKILLFVYEPGACTTGATCFLKCYESVNGLGTDFALKATIYTKTQASNANAFTPYNACCGVAIQSNTGRILVTFGRLTTVSGTYWHYQPGIAYSDDDGATWTTALLYNSGYGSGYGFAIRTLAKAGTTRLLASHVAGSANYIGKFYYSDNDGVTWTACSNYTPISGEASYACPHNISSPGDGYSYLFFFESGIAWNAMWCYRRLETDDIVVSGQTPYGRGTGLTWPDKMNDTGFGDDGMDLIFMADVDLVWGYQSIAGSSSGFGVYGGVRIENAATIQVSKFSLSREEAANAQACTISFPNVNPDDHTDAGYYSPYRAGGDFPLKPENEWYCQIVTSKRVKVEAGYGTDIASVFTGRIDTVDHDTQPGAATLALSCRDEGWRLVDKTATSVVDGVLSYYITYPIEALATTSYLTTDMIVVLPKGDEMIFTSDLGGPVTLKLTQATYTGAGLATHLQTVMNANTTLTGTGTITFTVSWNGIPREFTISCSGAHTIAFTFTGSTAGVLFGFTTDIAAANSVVSPEPYTCTIEMAAKDLLIRAGFAAADITIEPTYQLCALTFDRMSYGDALEELMTLSGFELVVDEDGKPSFHYPTDRQPEVLDEDVTLTGSAGDAYTVALLHMNGSDGGVIFTDEKGHTVTPSGNTYTETSIKKFGTASAYFDGTGDYLSITDSDDFYFASGDWTIDFWLYFPSYSAASRYCLFNHRTDTSSNYFLGEVNVGRLGIGALSGGTTLVSYNTAALAWSSATWYHIAFVRHGSTITMYRNGVAQAVDTGYYYTAFTGGAFPNYTGAFQIGQWSANRYLTGYIDEFRISKGVAQWTADFTPPTAEYSASASAIDLAEYPVVTDSIVVWSATGKTGTLYAVTTDYIITAGDPDTPWTIVRSVGSSIPDGATVYVSYVYAAWVFQEGVDLFQLSLTLDQSDIYGKIIVEGTDCSGTYVTTSPRWDTSTIESDKILFVSDENLYTNAQCQACANRLGVEMLAHGTAAVFAAVAVPWLQVGDCVQIIESSTTISEIYRITEISLDFGSDGAVMTFSAYHYGYAPI